MFFFRIYLQNHLSYKKVIYIYLHPCVKTFLIRSQNLLIFAKMLFCQKKVSYWKKSAILKKSKTFFHGLRFRHWNYIQTSFRLKKYHATSSSQAKCVCCIFVNQIFISCRKNTEQIRYLFLSICSLWIGHLFEKKKFSFRHYFNESWWKSDSQKYRKHI